MTKATGTRDWQQPPNRNISKNKREWEPHQSRWMLQLPFLYQRQNFQLQIIVIAPQLLPSLISIDGRDKFVKLMNQMIPLPSHESKPFLTSKSIIVHNIISLSSSIIHSLSLSAKRTLETKICTMHLSSAHKILKSNTKDLNEDRGWATPAQPCGSHPKNCSLGMKNWRSYDPTWGTVQKTSKACM